jgi:hypothetical protein
MVFKFIDIKINIYFDKFIKITTKYKKEIIMFCCFFLNKKGINFDILGEGIFF